MKQLFFILICGLFALTVQAQRGSGSRVLIDSSQIPDSVKNAQSKLFAGVTVSRWEEHVSQSPRKGGTQYLAEFTDQNGVRLRARYTSQGKNINVTRFYIATKIPAVVTAAMQRYPGYRAMIAEEIKLIEKQKTFYKVRIRNGTDSRTLILDEKGNEVPKGNSEVEVEPEGENH